MQQVLEELQKQNAETIEENERLRERIEKVVAQNHLLNQKVQLLLKRLFGRKTEKIDPNQLELLLGELEALGSDNDEDPPPSPPRPRRKRKASNPRLPEDLPTEDIVLEPDEVKRNPEAYQCIGEEITQELDVDPSRYFVRRFIRPEYTSKDDRSQPPIIAPLPPRLIEKGYASPGLLCDIIVKKYVDHLPLNRQEQILRRRYGIELSRKTMSDWVRVVADWLKPIYNHIGDDLRGGDYLQVDETPVRYCRAEGGGSGQGYLWVYHRPGAEVLYRWHTGRGAACLAPMLKGFSGTVQCDGYSAYTSYAKGRNEIDLVGCWAHVHRKFHDALEESPTVAG